MCDQSTLRRGGCASFAVQFMVLFTRVPLCVVDIREIRDVREGTDSKDFERQQGELKKIDQFCFVIFYTSEFKFKTLSVAGTCDL